MDGSQPTRCASTRSVVHLGSESLPAPEGSEDINCNYARGAMTPHRYSVVTIDHEDDQPVYEVRCDAQGTHDDWDPGTWVASFENKAEADEFAAMLREQERPADARSVYDLSDRDYSAWSDHHRPGYCGNCGNDWPQCRCTPEDLE